MAYYGVQTSSTLFDKNENIKGSTQRLDVAQPKYDYLLSLQINNYLKKKDRKYEFLDAGEKDEFKIL